MLEDKPRFNRRRLFLQIAFWFVLIMLLSTVILQVVNIGNQEGLSAYDDDWNDMSAFKEDINKLGIETKSLVSSPLLLADIEDPANATFIIAGVERDTISLPQFSSDGFLTFAAEDGYSPAEVEAIKEFVFAGGDVLVMDDYGYQHARLNACGYSMGTTFAPNWMDWPMFYQGNPVVLEEGMVFFMHMILMDSETGRAMNLGESFVLENGTGSRLSRSSRELFVV